MIINQTGIRDGFDLVFFLEHRLHTSGFCLETQGWGFLGDVLDGHVQIQWQWHRMFNFDIL